MLQHFARSRRLLAGVAVVSALVAAGVVTASVASAGRVLALPGATESTVVTVEPTRVLDTRYNIGVTGKLVAGKPKKLQVTGTITTWTEANKKSTRRVVVPAGATAVLLNVTAVSPTGAGSLSIRPGNATGVPATAGLNFTPGDVVANTITVAVPTTGANAGKIGLYYGTGTKKATMDVVIDVVGYTTNTGLLDLVNRVTALETGGVAGPAGPAGPAGAPGVAGAPGAPGPAGAPGAAGVNAESPAQVIWVADDGTGDYLLLSSALAAITDATPSKPYVIKIAPGIYTETTPVVLKGYVDVEGSGQDITTINCACSANSLDASAAVMSAGAITAEIRHLTINNTGNGNDSFSFGLYTNGVTNGSFSMLHVTATVTTNRVNMALYNVSSSPSMNNVTATATGGVGSIGVYNVSSSPSMNNVTATATGSTNDNIGVNNSSSSSPSIRNSSITGATRSIYNGGSSAKVADTALGGGNVTGGGFTCVGVYTTAFVALNASCA
jgi:hypothetical protein